MSNWFTVKEIDEKTWRISEEGFWNPTHSYLLAGTKFSLLIDTGTGIDNIKNITDNLTELPVKVITTHAHWDHTGGHRFYDEIYIHREDLLWITEGLPLSLNMIRKALMLKPHRKPLPKDFKIESYFPYRGEAAGVLKDNDIIEPGGRKIRVIHTPGHSPGHISLYEEDKGYLFTGDVLYKGTLYAFYPSTCPEDFSESLQKLCNLKNIIRIFPGHHEPDLDRVYLEKVNEAFLELKEKNLLKHGTGVFEFSGFKIKL